MIPDNVEKIIMTKENYDRNVEQLLFREIELEEKNKLIKEKLELLLKDLKDMQDLEKEKGKQFFTTQLFAIRIKELYKEFE